ncbi:CaiB/BaiF CoA transferase family protein [Chloroflexota bacterium]
MKNKGMDSPLGPYRVLDLTEGGCMIGGRLLADLGADVIKIEPPGGSRSRIAPFYKNEPHSEKSLYWFAYNMNKRSITLDINKEEGQEIFKRLVKTADIVMESFDLGHMAGLSMGYEHLTEIKPAIIMASITPFGQTGPKAHYKGSDLTAWASGGYLYVCGDADRAPTWISFPQASPHAGVEAASGAMAALWYRRRSGEGQHVDVSMQECVVACSFNTPEMWDLNKVEFMRCSGGVNIGTGGVRSNHTYKCRDGYLILVSQGGVQPFVGSMSALVKWMEEEGMAEDWLKEMDWAADYDASKLTQEKVDRVDEAISKFLLTKTKKELYEGGALKRRILLAPMSTTKDMYESEQLQARDFWIKVEHEELGDTLTYPGPPLRLSENPISCRRRAPLIGEHNTEIYQELGLTGDELIILAQASVI